jgi:hypothetical protein
MLKVILRGSLRVRIVVKRIRVREIVREVTLKAGESNNT